MLDGLEWVETIIGITLISIGSVGLLNNYNVIAFQTEIINNLIGTIGIYLISISGILMILKNVPEIIGGNPGTGFIYTLIGIAFASILTINLLNKFQIVGFKFPEITTLILYIIITIEGIILLSNPLFCDY